MTHARDNFVAWLRNAHAMEEQAATLLAAQVKRIETYPDLKARLSQHLEETRVHAELLKDLLDKSSGSASPIRTAAARLSAATQGITGMLTHDEVVKDLTSGYAFEHLEIGTYRVLIAAADELGDDEARLVFERILGEEEKMAQWFGDHLDGLTRIFLMRDERDLLAKR
ncbi:MAG: ferritin-like domain-containing protein [Neorhizobium sp.]|nr:ferritin-like domain-containing protein [Neorhizobium sp.]